MVGFLGPSYESVGEELYLNYVGQQRWICQVVYEWPGGHACQFLYSHFLSLYLTLVTIVRLIDKLSLVGVTSKAALYS